MIVRVNESHVQFSERSFSRKAPVVTENVNQILKKLKSHFHFRGIILSDCFEDFDKTNSGLVTESQVRINLLFCTLLFLVLGYRRVSPLG